MRSQAEAWLSERLAPGNGLPYPGQERHRIIAQLADLTQEFSSLTVKTQTYTHNTGSSLLLLSITGTLPMYYAGAKYNIPVRLWLPEKFPYAAPLVFVEPTSEMMIMQNHPFVNANGAVSTDYIRQWGRSSALVDLCQDTMIGFGQSPPLYARPPPGTRPPPSARPPVQPPQEPASSSFSASNPIHRPSQYGQSTPPPPAQPPRDQSPWGGAVAAGHGPRQPPFSPAASTPDLHPPSRPDGTAALEAAARQALTVRLQESLKLAHADAAPHMDQLLATQRDLQSRSQVLQAGVHSMQRERVALEQSTNELNGRAVALGRWLDTNEAKMPAGDVSADSAIVPADALSAQALTAQAEDLALEDAMYELDRALPESTQPIEVYLKQIRSLCRKQFFARALGNKVAARQHNQRAPASSQQGRQPAAVQMPQGDSWASPGVLGGGYMGGFSNPLSQHR